MNLKEKLQSDHYVTGILISLLLPLVTALLVVPAGRWVLSASRNLSYFDSRLFLLCLIPNLLIMRYHLVRKKQEKSGKVILIVTVLWVGMYFIFAHSHPFNLPL